MAAERKLFGRVVRAYDPSTRAKVVELRRKGTSLRGISRETGVPKRTVVGWVRGVAKDQP